MTERLQKFLSRAGIASRRHAEGLIAEGRVSVNNERVTTLGTKVDPEKDLVSVDGKVVSLPEEKAYYLLYKPSGMVTTLEDPQGRPTVKDLLGEVGRRVFPVGRLDWDAEGALLFTDDGDLAHHLMHPSFEVPRTYLAKVKGVPDPASLDKLRGGVRLEDGMATPDAVEIFEAAERNTWLKLVVSEGRPHLVKRLCAAIGHPVVRLFRPAQGGVGVEGMRPGQLRPLTPAEVERVHQVAEGKAFPPPALRLPPRRHGRSGEAEEEGAEPFEVPGRAPRASAKSPRAKTSGARGGERRAFSGSRTRGASFGKEAAETAPRAPTAGRKPGGSWEKRGAGSAAERVWRPRGSEAEGESAPPRRTGAGSRAGGVGGPRGGAGERGGAGRSFGGPRGGAGERGGAGRSFGGPRAGAGERGGAGRSFGGPRAGAGERGAGRSFGGPRAGAGERGEGRSFGGPRAGAGERGAGRSFGGPRAGAGERGGAGRSFGGPRGGAGERGGEGRSFGGPRAGAGERGGAGRSFGGPRAGAGERGGAGHSFGGPRAGAGERGGAGRSFGGSRAGAGERGGAGRSFGGPRAGAGERGGEGRSFGGPRAGAGERSFGGPRAGAGDRGRPASGGRPSAGRPGVGKPFGGPRGGTGAGGVKPRGGGKFGKPAARPTGARKGGPGRGPGRGR